LAPVKTLNPEYHKNRKRKDVENAAKFQKMQTRASRATRLQENGRQEVGRGGRRNGCAGGESVIEDRDRGGEV